ncbi:MAG: hypothetical protein K5768_08570 [Firmicutes bacterium]|nr:hypothetical protein [Bacillota bacterium]
MKIKYEFATESIEVDVPDEWGSIIIELDRQEYNINRKETRRHCPLDRCWEKYKLYSLLPSLEDTVLEREQAEEIRKALQTLKYEHRELLEQVYFYKKRIATIAREKGMDQSSLRKKFRRAEKALRKVLQK